jgi:hypothetical protein
MPDMERDEVKRETVNLAFGRIFRLLSRPAQPGDMAEYERCRGLILDLLGEPAERVESRPLPGWNFGHGNTGSIE